jgi:hypothetical protein
MNRAFDELYSSPPSRRGEESDRGRFAEPKGCTPAEFAQLIKSDLEQWAATVKAFGFRPMD